MGRGTPAFVCSSAGCGTPVTTWAPGKPSQTHLSVCACVRACACGCMPVCMCVCMRVQGRLCDRAMQDVDGAKLFEASEGGDFEALRAHCECERWWVFTGLTGAQ